MCDPISLAISAALAAAGAAQTASANRKANDQKKAAADFARQQSIIENDLQKQLQRKSNALINENLEGQTQEAQQALLDKESAELTERFGQDQSTAPANIGDLILSGQKTTGRVAEDFAGKVAEGSADARRRIAALANLSSFGKRSTSNQIGGSKLGTDIAKVRSDQAGGLRSLAAGNQLANSFTANIDNTTGELLSGLGNLGLRATAGGGKLGSLFGSGVSVPATLAGI